MLPFALSCIEFDWIWRLLLNSTQLWKIFLHYVQCFPVVRPRRFSNAVGLPIIIVFKQIVSQCSFMTCYGAPANTLSGFWPKQESQISLPALLQSHRLPHVLHAGWALNRGSWSPKRNLDLLQLLLQFIVPLGWLFLLNRKLLFHQENISLKTLQRVSCSLNRSWGTDFLFQKLDINFHYPTNFSAELDHEKQIRVTPKCSSCCPLVGSSPFQDLSRGSWLWKRQNISPSRNCSWQERRLCGLFLLRFCRLDRFQLWR